MKRLFFAFIVAILVATIATPLACKPPAKFEVTAIEVVPSEVTVGQMATVTVQIKNTGGSEGVYAATLIIDGVEAETKSVTLPPATTEVVTFKIAKDKAGTYQITVGGLGSSLKVKEKPPPLEQLKVSYPELFQELFKLPELIEIDAADVEAIEDIAHLALDPKNKDAFELILKEGLPDKRKYCTPLQALLWIAYDKEFNGYNPLREYPQPRLIRDLVGYAWRYTSVSKDYASERWQNFEEVVSRLNSPTLISIYTSTNIKYQSETINEYVPARLVFERKVDDCDGFATFQAYLLKANGYEAWNVGIAIRTPTGHNVCAYISDGSYWVLDVGGRMKGPFRSLDELADSYIPGAEIVLFNPFDITSPITGSAFQLPHKVYRR